MPTNILTPGTTDTDSADVTVAAGSTLTVSLKDAAGPIIPGGGRIDILLKDDSGQYFLVDTLDGSKPAVIINGAGIYRFSRKAGTSCGVFSA